MSPPLSHKVWVTITEWHSYIDTLQNRIGLFLSGRVIQAWAIISSVKFKLYVLCSVNEIIFFYCLQKHTKAPVVNRSGNGNAVSWKTGRMRFWARRGVPVTVPWDPQCTVQPSKKVCDPCCQDTVLPFQNRGPSRTGVDCWRGGRWSSLTTATLLPFWSLFSSVGCDVCETTSSYYVWYPVILLITLPHLILARGTVTSIFCHNPF